MVVLALTACSSGQQGSQAQGSREEQERQATTEEEPAPSPSEDLVSATGVLERPEITTYMYGTHAVVDEAAGDRYALQSESVELDGYLGQRVTVYGLPIPGYENGQIEGGPPLLNVTRIEPA
jgi:hypothetical protein